MRHRLIEVLNVSTIACIGRYMNTGSEKRMREMLKRAGVDSEIAIHGNTEAVIKEMRRQCRSCENEYLCDRWIAGDVVKGGISFCPNARMFRNLARKTRRAS